MTGATYPSLEGHGVFVSGGASGIGATIVRRFLGQGAHVATVDIAQDPEYPEGVWAQRCDARDTEALQRAITEANREIGLIRVLVNNPARDDRFENTEMSEAEWDEMLAVNLGTPISPTPSSIGSGWNAALATSQPESPES